MRVDFLLDPFYVLGALWGLTPGTSVCPANPHVLPPPPSAGVTAFVNVNVIPMDTERVLENQTVLVEGGRITALGPSDKVPVPATVVRIDGRGKYLMPGLADMHVHTGDLTVEDIEKFDMLQQLLSYELASGVTTLRHISGGSTADPKQMWRYTETGMVPIPRIYLAPRLPLTSWLDSSMAPYVAAANAVGAHVAAAKAAGYHHLAPEWLYAAWRGNDTLRAAGRAAWNGEARSRAERLVFDSMVAAARRVGLPVAMHSHGLPFDAVLAVGTTGGSTEHVYEYFDSLGMRTMLQSRAPVDVPRAKLQALAAATRRAGVWVTPTLSCTDKYDPTPSALTALRQIVKALHDAGVGLLLSADDGYNVHDELAALVRAGLSPYQALATGTRNPAQFFGRLDSAGTVAVGKWADLVLLEGNPLRDIRHTREPAGVMVAGRWLDRAMLDRRLLAPMLASPTEWFAGSAWSQGIVRPLIEEPRRKFEAHAAKLKELVDSAARAKVPAVDSESRWRRVAEELGAMRALLTTPEQHEAFDAAARTWRRAQARS